MRIPVDLTKDAQQLTVHLDQEFDNLEVLSLKITNSDAYTRQCSDYGVLVGRVMLNSGFGVQNAKVSVFIPITNDDQGRDEITQLYPFQTVNDTFPNGVRYNLLPRVRNERNPSHRAVGNFPTAGDFSHYPQYLEIMDNYYKYTTVTNESGDYMIFGLPLGQLDLIMDFDVLDTNSFDLSANDLVDQITLAKSIKDLETLINSNATDNPIDPYKVPGFIYKGNNNYDIEVQTTLDNMVNIFHEVKKVTISPFWGDDSFCDVGITRCDFKVNFTYTPTAIFFGYIHSGSGGFTVKPDYSFNIQDRRPEILATDSSLGYMTGDLYPYQKMQIVVYSLDDQRTPGSRKRLGVFDGSLYNGIFRVSLPMYMDYYTTNEFGDLINTTDTTLGIPTKGYYAFEIYDTDDRWMGRRVAWGGYENPIVPGVRIPMSGTGDPNLGGWDGTNGGLFEYDLLNRKRKFYTVKTIHSTHNNDNILLPGNTVGYFPQFNPNKADAFWNFPVTQDNVVNYEEPTIIGSILLPRLTIDGTNYPDGQLDRPDRLVNEYYIDQSDTFNQQIKDCEMYLGIGVQKNGGTNSGNVFTTIFGIDEFVDSSGNSVFGDNGTWNYGDNTVVAFTPSLFAVQLSGQSGANANGNSVLPAFNQVVHPQQTYGVFINGRDYTTKVGVLEVLIYDITTDLPDLIKDGVYSSYNKGHIGQNQLITANNLSQQQQTDPTEIYLEEDGIIYSDTGAVISTVDDNNAYKGKFYYFGMWNEANALYDIQTNYFIK